MYRASVSSHAPVRGHQPHHDRQHAVEHVSSHAPGRGHPERLGGAVRCLQF